MHETSTRRDILHPAQARPPARWPLAVLAVLVVVLAAAAFMFRTPRGPSAAELAAAVDTRARTAAVTSCQAAVADQLKSPATARFSEVDAQKVDDAGKWVLRGVVDAQNGFGALVRLDWSCEAQVTNGFAVPSGVNVHQRS